MCKIGRVDIITEVLMLSSHLALPREGHFLAALHIMLASWASATTVGWYLIQPTPMLTMMHSLTVTGLNFTARLRKQSRLMPRYHVVERCKYGCILTVTTPVISRCDNPEQG